MTNCMYCNDTKKVIGIGFMEAKCERCDEETLLREKIAKEVEEEFAKPKKKRVRKPKPEESDSG